jgi:hypothetical protein
MSEQSRSLPGLWLVCGWLAKVKLGFSETRFFLLSAEHCEEHSSY